MLNRKSVIQFEVEDEEENDKEVSQSVSERAGGLERSISRGFIAKRRRTFPPLVSFLLFLLGFRACGRAEREREEAVELMMEEIVK